MKLSIPKGIIPKKLKETAGSVTGRTKELLLKRSKESRGYHAALDIGTEVVKVIIFTVDEEGVAHVWGVGREKQRLTDMQNGAVSDIAGVAENTERALSVAEAMAKHSPKDAIIGIAGELVKGLTTRVDYVRSQPESKLTMGELDAIMDKVEKEAAARVKGEIVRTTGLSAVEMKFVNASIVDVKIDGYKITNPIGFQGKDVAVSIYNAFAPLVHLGALETVSGEIGLDVMSIAAEPYAIARTVASEAAQEFSAVFMDIGGGTTDIAVVVNGGLLGTEMFAIGGRSFTKRLANLMGVTFKEAEEMKLKYSDNLLDDDAKKKASELYNEDIKVWLSGVELALEQFKNAELFPSHILLTGGGSLLPEVSAALESEWWQRSKFAKKPLVQFLKPDAVPRVVDHTGELGKPQDMTVVGLTNLARTMSHEESLLNEILKRVTKSMEV